MTAIAHFTTLVPVDLDRQLEKLASWREVATSGVYTVNHQREYALLKPQLPAWVSPVEVRFAQRLGRDYIPLRVLKTAIARVLPASAQRVLLANSDIELTDRAALEPLCAPSSDLVFASRQDVGGADAAPVRYDKGYDVFSFKPSALGCLDLDELCLGVPWWDYIVPVSAVLSGYATRRLDCAAFAHQVHAQRWSSVAFDYLGWASLERLLPGSAALGPPTHAKVLAFARACNAFLNADSLASGAQPPHALREQFLRQVRAALASVAADSAHSGQAPTPASANPAPGVGIGIGSQLLAVYRRARAADAAGRHEVVAAMEAIADTIAAAPTAALVQQYQRYARLLALRLDDAGLERALRERIGA